MKLFLCGDVMAGRGIDQILRFPGDPVLYESYVRDAREYVRLAERANGAIAKPVDDTYIWGAALEEMSRAAPDVRIVNLETSITSSDRPWPAKEVHYRMHPRNVGCLTAAGIDCCCLANNHVLDWGVPGLLETLETLERAGVRYAGAGRGLEQAEAPAVLEVPGRGRVLVFGFGSETSGIPRTWAAQVDRPGVRLLPDLSLETADRIARQVQAARCPGDVVVASIHWGRNWSHEVPAEQRRFAQRLIDSGVDLVHGHSSHHVKAVEMYRGHPILYGCGEFIDDYEGIDGVDACRGDFFRGDLFRGDLCLMYFAEVDPLAGGAVQLRLVPLQLRQLRLNPPSTADVAWLCDRLNREGTPLGTRVRPGAGRSLLVSEA